jgi:hypothetical protein
MLLHHRELLLFFQSVVQDQVANTEIKPTPPLQAHTHWGCDVKKAAWAVYCPKCNGEVPFSMPSEFKKDKVYSEPRLKPEVRKMCPTGNFLFSLGGLPIHQFVWEEPGDGSTERGSRIIICANNGVRQ